MKDKTVEINRETAMSIWTKSYGKATKAKDFAGREMDKSAYDQRGSKYGWNLDHILPKSRGGKDTESNLICTHIETNDEKADKFPCFTANGKQFEIIKVENHYEIREKTADSSKASDSTETKDKGVNLFDSAAGIKLYKKLEKDFIGTVTIELRRPKSAAIKDFIQEIFSGETVVVEPVDSYCTNYEEELKIRVTDIRLPTVDSTQALLDKFITLNTYLEYYFLPEGYISGYKLFCEAHTKKDELKCLRVPNFCITSSRYNVAINELIRCNSNAKKDLPESYRIDTDNLGYNVYSYNYWWTKLAENLKKN